MDLNSSTKTHSLLTPRIAQNYSIAKSVKYPFPYFRYNNLTFITGEELCKLRRQPQEPSDNPEFSTAKNNMTNIKKRYDQTNHEKLYLENKLQRLNEEKDKLSSLVHQFESNKSSGKSKVSSLETELEQIKLKLLEKDFERMSMTQMRDVIVHDKIVYDKKKFDMEKELRKMGIKAKSIKETNLHLAEEDDRTVKVYEKFISKLESENKEREEHINSIESRVFEKEGVQNSSVLRKSQMMNIAETTMCERDPEEKEWINIFLTHKFLKDLLETKIEREMQKFSQVQNAFKNIKIATGVNDAQTLVKKFLSKEEVYGDLLSKITENQREIQELRKEKQKHLREIKKSEEELQQLQAIKVVDADLREWLKKAEYYDERTRRADYQQMKLKQYLFKQLKRINEEKQETENKETQQKDGSVSTQKKQGESTALSLESQQQMKNSLIKHLKQLSLMIDESQKMILPSNPQKQTNDTPIMNEQAITKVFRVKPHVKAQFNDKNFDSEYIHPYEEQEITTASNYLFKILGDQVQAVDEQRAILLKSNEKFMKELRRKIDQQKQLIVENLVKNAKEKAAPIPVKKVEIPQE